MSQANVPKPEIGGDLVRVHRAITRAVNVAQEYGTAYATSDYPNPGTQKGYLTYVRCLAAMLHAHHVTEDEAMFPALRDRLPNAPYEALMAQHSAMVPVLKGIEAAVARTGDLTGLNPALLRIGELWNTHIALEETHFGPDAVAASLTMEERVRAGQLTARQAARHQRPLVLLIPFLLYNMEPQDRAVMFQLMPSFVPVLLRLFKPRWRRMIPFLLIDR